MNITSNDGQIRWDGGQEGPEDSAEKCKSRFTHFKTNFLLYVFLLDCRVDAAGKSNLTTD